MGYTHYLHIPKDTISKSNFKKIVSDIEVIETYIKKHKTKCVTADCIFDKPIKLDITRYGKEVNGKFICNEIYINGVGELAHEALVLCEGKQDSFNHFCKTARKPYDTAVCLALISLKYVIKDTDISSDGDLEEWQGAIDLWKVIFPERNFEFILD